MLTLERRNGESLKIFPAGDLPSDMTVEELFSEGPLEITLTNAKKGKAKVSVRAPLKLIVRRDELV